MPIPALSRTAHPDRWPHPLLLIVLSAVGAFLLPFLASGFGSR